MEALRRAYAAGYRAPLLQGPTGSVARLKGRLLSSSYTAAS
jgi:hypothetical protein